LEDQNQKFESTERKQAEASYKDFLPLLLQEAGAGAETSPQIFSFPGNPQNTAEKEATWTGEAKGPARFSELLQLVAQITAQSQVG